MKFVLVGCSGRMGNEILKAASATDQIVAGVDVAPHPILKTYSALNLVTEEYDAVIDFSTSTDRFELLSEIKKQNVPYGCFATNISTKDEDDIKKLSKSVPVIRQKNTSVAVSLLFDAVENFSKSLKEAEVSICEWHHKNKKDAPSGTAKQIEYILEQNELPYQTVSIRAGSIFGTHLVQFFMDGEILEIKHTASSRSIFARGALKSMHWLAKQKKGYYAKIKS